MYEEEKVLDIFFLGRSLKGKGEKAKRVARSKEIYIPVRVVYYNCMKWTRNT